MSAESVVINLINKANGEYSLFSRGQKIGIALSGGKDSVCLIHSLNILSKEMNFSLCGLHFNHGIRGKESDRDEEFCRKLCESLEIPFYSEKGNVPLYASQNKTGCEEAARILRYEFLYKCREKAGLDLIATAHTSSDNAETVIFNLCRGTGTRGLCGIPAKRDCIIRPMIFVSTSQVLDFIKEKNLDFVYDSTNGDKTYKRNRIRHNICPELSEINPDFEKAISNTAAILKTDEDFILSVSEKYFAETKTDILSKLHTSPLSRVIIYKYGEYKKGKQLSSSQVSEVVSMIRSYNGGKKYISLPNKVRFVIDNGNISFTADNREKLK